MASGNQAVTGTGRSNCSVGSSMVRMISTRPISMPSGSATSAARPKPP